MTIGTGHPLSRIGNGSSVRRAGRLLGRRIASAVADDPAYLHTGTVEVVTAGTPTILTVQVDVSISTTLGAAVLADASSITLGSAADVYAGSPLQINDSPSEVVIVGPTYTGGTTIPLLNPTQYGHSSGAGVTAPLTPGVIAVASSYPSPAVGDLVLIARAGPVWFAIGKI